MTMYPDYVQDLDEEGLLDEPQERTSDIQLAPAMSLLLLATWLMVCLIGFGIMFLAKNPLVGAVVIAVPTFIGMVLKPTFALCILMLVLPTGAGVGFQAAFSLDRGVGIAVAVSFFLNVLLTRPGLRIRHKSLWVAAGLSVWIALTSLAQPYLSMEIRRAFTQFQLVLLVVIAYWILETNYENTFRWALRSYVIGTLGTMALAVVTGATMRAAQETGSVRYAATVGNAIDANMMAAMTSVAFLSAVYLFARDRRLFWRLVWLVALLLLPIMTIRTGSRGGMIALVFTLLSPLLFLRQVLRRPALAALLLLVVLLASVSAGLVIKKRGLDTSVSQRLTDVGQAREALEFRMEAVRKAAHAALVWPAGTGYYSWFERTGSSIWPHNDFFFALGVYGVPGALLFTVFVILLMLTVWRTPLTLEKLYARAVLTFLLVMGLNIKQLSAKYYWVFLAFVLAAERLSWWHLAPAEEATEDTDEEAPDTDD